MIGQARFQIFIGVIMVDAAQKTFQEWLGSLNEISLPGRQATGGR